MFVLLRQQLKPFPRIVAIVMLALVYYATAELSRHVAATPQAVTPVWPPDGFAAAAVLTFGIQILPGVFIGSFLANIWAFFNADSLYMGITSTLQVIGIAIGTTIGAGVGNYLLRRSIKGRDPFRKLNDTYKFLGFIGLVIPIINATIGVICLCLGGNVSWSAFVQTWLTWWISNVAGICIFTPAILSWYTLRFKIIRNHVTSSSSNRSNTKETKQWKIRIWRVSEAVILTLIVFYISLISFYENYHLEYILLPCLVWSVLRFGQFGATNLIVIITMIAVLGTVRELGTFAFNNSHYSLILLQSFIIVIVVTTLSLNAILSEKQQAIANLQHSKTRLTNKSNQLESSKAILKTTALMLEQKNAALTEAKKFAEKASLTKTEFLSNMSHELRTPLHAILGFVQLLQESPNLDQQDKSDLQTVYKSGIHLLNLINDILDISKIEVGKLELQSQDIFFYVFLKDLVEINRIQAVQKKINFFYDFSDNLPELVLADAKRLKQVILNLLSNAIKFTDQGYVIFRVRADQVEGVDDEIIKPRMLIHFEVEDTGIGIPEDKLESIFLPFEQTGDTKFKVQGTGLGLAISQKILAMMDSKITVSSQKGVGSIFRFTICLETPKSTLVDQLHDSIDRCAINQEFPFDRNLAKQLPLKILLAEDNIINQKVALKILNQLGYEISIVNNGVKVLEALNEHIYDVILMDVQMPEMNGIETTKQILQNQSLSQRPYIIAMTANAMDGDRLICLEAGMDDYISKPIDVNLLVEALWKSQYHRQGNDTFSGVVDT